MRKYAADSEGIRDGGEMCAVAVAVWAAQRGILFETTRWVASIPLRGTLAYPLKMRLFNSGQR